MPDRRVNKPTIAIAERRADAATIAQLTKLLDDAKRGDLSGAIVAAHYGGREYAYMGSGSLCQDPRLGLHAALTLAKKMLP